MPERTPSTKLSTDALTSATRAHTHTKTHQKVSRTDNLYAHGEESEKVSEFAALLFERNRLLRCCGEEEQTSKSKRFAAIL